MKTSLSDPRGFTMIEILIAVSIIGILASIAVPKLSNAIRKGNEAATRGKLGNFRSSLNIYYAEQEGQYPYDLSPMTQPGSKYMTGALPLWTQAHGTSAAIEYTSGLDRSLDTGRWGYSSDQSGGDFGTIWIQCTHTDITGTAWSQY